MIYLATASGPAVRAAMLAGQLGLMATQGSGPDLASLRGVPWAADNGAFANDWTPTTWWNWLAGLPTEGCLFAVVPDVVADATATAQLWATWYRQVADLGMPAAYVLQDDEQGPPWDQLDCLFIGGTTDYKMGPAAASWAREAKARGKWLHMGRVNTRRRLRYAAALGCDSVDGTFLAFGPDANLPRLLRFLHDARQQHTLFSP